MHQVTLLQNKTAGKQLIKKVLILASFYYICASKKIAYYEIIAVQIQST